MIIRLDAKAKYIIFNIKINKDSEIVQSIKGNTQNLIANEKTN